MALNTNGKQGRPGLTLVELLLVMSVLLVLAGILLATQGPARKMARVATCTSHLRQIGLAFRLYREDYDQYPDPRDITLGPYIRDRRILVCPEDTSVAPLGAASSYRYRNNVPPGFTPLTDALDLDPNVVLVSCEHHLGQRYIVEGDNARQTSPVYPFHLVLRASGQVERIHLSRIKQFFQSRDRPVLKTLYPGEPGYDEVPSSSPQVRLADAGKQ